MFCTPIPPVQLKRPPLGRCDVSQSEAAYVRVELKSGELQFCAHHYREYMDALESQGAQLVQAEGVPA